MGSLLTVGIELLRKTVVFTELRLHPNPTGQSFCAMTSCAPNPNSKKATHLQGLKILIILFIIHSS